MKPRREDVVLRALSVPSRRKIIDLLRARPGRTASELAADFPFSRVALTKHVRVLERGGLVAGRREGRERRLFVQEAPLAEALAKGLERCAPLWTERLLSLKTRLEGKERSMAESPRHVYVVYIRTTAEKLWEALTTPEETKRFYFGTEVRSRLEPGAPIEYVLTDASGKERVPVVGEVVEVVPNRRLVHTFRFPSNPDEPTRVTYEIEPAGAGTVKLTLTHDGFAGETKTWKEVGGGWPQIVSALKTLLETGQELEID
jgi:uncharacterized protein YndB with AHSA1/START domain/DNA-binding transcriptional ArsR family regulator